MSTKSKSTSVTGVRYTPAQKKEVLDFVAQYNSSHAGRGGQSAASKKFGVTPLTISGWLKSGSSSAAAPKEGNAVAAKKAAKPAAKKAAKKAAKGAAKKAPAKAAKSGKPARGVQIPALGRANRGIRYSPDHKQEVVDFVESYNAAKGRGGQRHAAKKYNVSVLTVANWLKAAGKKGARGAAKPAAKVSKSVAKKSSKAATVAPSKRGGDPAEELRQLKAALRALIS